MPEDKDEGEGEYRDEKEKYSFVKSRRKCRSMRMMMSKETKDPKKKVNDTMIVKGAYECMSVTLSLLNYLMIFHQSHNPSTSLTALQSNVSVARAHGCQSM